MLTRSPRRALDIGCSDGTVGQALRRRGAEVWGIDRDPALAAMAAQRLDRVISGDALVEVDKLVSAGERFDLVICADSLEHMAEPQIVLSGVRKLLQNDGESIVSLPNVRFYTTFTNLGLRGRWPVRARGVHDRTHLRWFTDRDARELFAGAGFEVEASLTHHRIADQPGRRVNRLAKYVARGPWEPFLAYQYVYRLRPRSDRG